MAAFPAPGRRGGAGAAVAMVSIDHTPPQPAMGDTEQETDFQVIAYTTHGQPHRLTNQIYNLVFKVFSVMAL